MNKGNHQPTKKEMSKEKESTPLHEQFVDQAKQSEQKTFDRDGFLGKGF